MEIRHASLLQIQRGRDGRKVLIENDVLDIVRQLQEIDPNLHVNFNEVSGHFSVVETCPDGEERLVTTVQELTPQLVDHIRKIGSESWNRELGYQIAKMDDEAKRDKDHATSERVGEIGERLHHALRADKEVKDRIWIPEPKEKS